MGYFCLYKETLLQSRGNRGNATSGTNYGRGGCVSFAIEPIQLAETAVTDPFFFEYDGFMHVLTGCFLIAAIISNQLWLVDYI